MARQIGKALHAHEPKIISGPEVLNKYVGESEANIRYLGDTFYPSTLRNYLMIVSLTHSFSSSLHFTCRGLFAEAEKEEKERGINSALHLIIFDEIDAICRARGSLVRHVTSSFSYSISVSPSVSNGEGVAGHSHSCFCCFPSEWKHWCP